MFPSLHLLYIALHGMRPLHFAQTFLHLGGIVHRSVVRMSRYVTHYNYGEVDPLVKKIIPMGWPWGADRKNTTWSVRVGPQNILGRQSCA